MATSIASAPVDPDVKKALADIQADLAELRTQLAAAVADLGTVRTAFNTAMTKLNADTGVADTNYAAAGSLTSVAPAALKTTA